jgi:hypothetical protein
MGIELPCVYRGPVTSPAWILRDDCIFKYFENYS